MGPDNETDFTYLEKEYDDFDAQSEHWDDYGQEYIKLSTDSFRGSFASAYLGRDVSVHYETMNSAMHCRVGCAEELIGFGVSLGQSRVAANGIRMDPNDVIITRPGSELELDVPSEGAAFLVLAVDLGTFKSMVGTDPGLEHLDPDSRKASVVRAECTANAIEIGGKALLRNCARAPGIWRPHSAAGAILAGTAAALALDAGPDTARERMPDGQSAAVVSAVRDALADMEEFDYAALTAATGHSPRSIQMAFAGHLGTTPFRYFRAVRLHHVRNVLLSGPNDGSETIGDIAAAHGFGNWGRFTQLYRRQFGETPSETRARVNGRPRPADAA